MPTNPMEPPTEPTRTKKAAAAVGRFGNKHNEAVGYALGILTGAALVLIASVVT